ncbi:MAG: hypothetical protein K6357_08480 [Elusimicrobiota bacterium]
MKEINIKIACFCISFVFKNSDEIFLNEVFQRYNSFLTKQKSNFRILTILNKEISFKETSVKLVFKNQKIFEIKREDFYFDGKTLIIKPNIYSFDSFLRIFMSVNLVKKNGFLLHTAGIKINKSAVLFVGKSGSGKTTISEMVKDNFEVLSDELLPIIVNKNGAYTYSSPFWGSMKRPYNKWMKLPVKNINFISKSDDFKIKKISFKSAYIKILKCLMNFNHDINVLSNIAHYACLLLSVSNYSILYFPKDKRKFIKGLFDNFIKG